MEAASVHANDVVQPAKATSACGSDSDGVSLGTVATVAAAAAVLGAGCPPASVLEPYGDPYPDVSPVVLAPNLKRLVDRITYGANAREAQLAEDLGYEGYLEYHLDPANINDADCDRQMRARFPTISYNAAQIVQRFYAGDYAPYDHFMNGTIFRRIYSRRQLLERVVEFWSDHFNIYLDKDGVTPLKIVDDRVVTRAHALGKFPDLLAASAHSPAMLVYLDNDPSVAGAPNQNYARELMELHTLGVDQYTQQDVEEVARCFTGWSYQWDTNKANFGTFRFDPYSHDADAKAPFGRPIPAGGGVEDGEQVLAWLSRDPELAPITAAFLARKLAVKFWGDNPPQALVQEIASAYLDHDGDIKAMLRVALAERWIATAPPKFKRPFHLIASALRSRPSQINEFWGIRYYLEQMNHLPYSWAPPNGYPEAGAYWMGFLLPRWRFAQEFVDWGLSATINWDALSNAPDDVAYMDAVNAYLGGGAYPFEQLQALYAYLREYPGDYWRRRETLALAYSTPSFQWF